MTAGYSLVATADAARRFPLSLAKVRTAEDFLTTGRRHFACRHVLDGAGPVFCTDHPHLGLRCILCLREHLVRHSHDEEYRCDECGRVVAGGLRAIVCSSMLAGLRIQEARGRRGRYTGLLSFCAVGCCSSCWRASA